MKKNLLWSLLPIMTVAMLSVCFVSCGGDDEDDEKTEEVTTASILGSWSYTKVRSSGSYISATYTFNEDGTYIVLWEEGTSSETYSGEESGTYVFDVTNMTLTLTTLVGEKLGTHSPLTVEIKNNQLTLIERDGDVRGPMSRK